MPATKRGQDKHPCKWRLKTHAVLPYFYCCWHACKHKLCLRLLCLSKLPQIRFRWFTASYSVIKDFHLFKEIKRVINLICFLAWESAVWWPVNIEIKARFFNWARTGRASVSFLGLISARVGPFVAWHLGCKSQAKCFTAILSSAHSFVAHFTG